MLKKMSVALLAASILAAPAFAAGPAKKDTSAKSTQTTGSTSGIAKSDASKSAVGTPADDKANTMKPTVGKSKGKPHASLIRHKHHHYAHVRHHNKVKALHASVNNKSKLGYHAAGHKKVSLKRVTPATRRG